MKTLLEDHDLILTEAAIVERLRRSGRVELHPSLVHANLIYDDNSKAELEKLYLDYISIAIRAQVPMLLLTPTWRANYDRVKNAGTNPEVNADSAHFMLDLRTAHNLDPSMIKIGGVIGCKNDSYKPWEALTTSESEKFHRWQVNHLAQADVDFLIGVTLPNVGEAIGIAKSMENTGTPYMLSFVIDRNGLVLDGTSLWDAVNKIDSITTVKPLCYMVNCSYPTFLHAKEQPGELFIRLLGIQANSSSLDHADLDGSAELHTESVAEWGEEMLKLNKNYGMKILGGCCGTDDTHISHLVADKFTP